MTCKRILAAALCAALLIVPCAFAQDDPEMDQAKRLYRNGNYRGTIEALGSLVDRDPTRADALYLVGYSHLMLREYAQSVEAFSQAFQADPTFDPRTIYHPELREAPVEEPPI